LPPRERAALAAGLARLATQQLEAALGLVLPRLAPALLAAAPPLALPTAAGGAGGAGGDSQPTPGTTAGDKAASDTAAGDKAAAEKAAATPAAGGKSETAAGAAAAAAAEGSGATDGAAAAPPPAAAAGPRLDVELDLCHCSALELRQLQHFLEACAHVAQTHGSSSGASAGASGGSGSAGAAAEDADGARLLSGFALGGAAEGSLSEHAGIAWPAVLLGAGLKACSPLLLTGHPDRLVAAQQAAAAGAAAGGGGAPHLPPRGPAAAAAALAGMKRRSSGECGRQRWRRGCVRGVISGSLWWRVVDASDFAVPVGLPRVPRSTPLGASCCCRCCCGRHGRRAPAAAPCLPPEPPGPAIQRCWRGRCGHRGRC
jgi:hypothetical protein